MNNSNQLLSTDNLYLRAPEPEDLELMYRMENDTTLWSVGNTLLPYSRYTLKKYIDNKKNDIYYTIIDKEKKTVKVTDC